MAETRNISGDLSVGKNLDVGGKSMVQGDAEVGHNLKVGGWLDAENVRGSSKGVYLDLQDLQRRYPTPRDGWYAGVLKLVGGRRVVEAYIGHGGIWVDAETTFDIEMSGLVYLEETKADKADFITMSEAEYEQLEEKRPGAYYFLYDGSVPPTTDEYIDVENQKLYIAAIDGHVLRTLGIINENKIKL